MALRLLGLPWGYLCQPANLWIAWLWGYWDYFGATFAKQQILGLHGFGATVATSGATLASQGFLAFPRFEAAAAMLLCDHCDAVFAMQSLA